MSDKHVQAKPTDPKDIATAFLEAAKKAAAEHRALLQRLKNA